MLYRQMGKTGEQLSALGYGCMRFPMKNGKIDEERTEKQILYAIEQGVNYFDTAYPYHDGRSEAVLGNILSRGYRDKVRIATKLPLYLINSRKDMDSILDTQLKRLKTDHVDYYLMHSLMDAKKWERLKTLGVLEFLEKAKQSGKIGHIGFSYHGDKADFKAIVDDYSWEFCQLQYNFLDENLQAGREGLQYAAAKGLGVMIMEPLRGGNLAGRIPAEAKTLWEQAEIKRTPAEWALRWLWDQPEVTVVLSGMNEEAHIRENIRTVGEGYPASLKPEERELVGKVREVYKKLLKVGCTGCRYCMPCPAGVDIPLCFSLYNNKYLFDATQESRRHYLAFTGISGSKPSYASLCKDCGKCEKACPQGLPVRKHLQDVAKEMELPFMKQLVWTAKKVFELQSSFRRP